MSLPVGPASGAVHQNGIGSKQNREQNAVAHQVDPKSEDFVLACVMVPVFVRVGSRARCASVAIFQPCLSNLIEMLVFQFSDFRDRT